MVRVWLSLLILVVLSGCAAAQAKGASLPSQAGLPPLPDYGPAPELTNTVWLNTPRPLRLADLRGKVVALAMWTFDCVNCQDEIPWLIDWNQKYSSQGLVIIANHAPEFNVERNLNNVKDAIAHWGIPYAVAIDNDFSTWDAYQTQYWPTLYLIDKAGNLRFRKIGEGDEAGSEAAILALLREKG